MVMKTVGETATKVFNGTLYDEDGEIEYKGEWKKGDYAN